MLAEDVLRAHRHLLNAAPPEGLRPRPEQPRRPALPPAFPQLHSHIYLILTFGIKDDFSWSSTTCTYLACESNRPNPGKYLSLLSESSEKYMSNVVIIITHCNNGKLDKTPSQNR
jgi:hypothetical protein